MTILLHHFGLRDVHSPVLLGLPRATQEIRVKVSRTVFGLRIKPQVRRTVRLLEEMCQRNDISKGTIDDVGELSRSRCIQEELDAGLWRWEAWIAAR